MQLDRVAEESIPADPFTQDGPTEDLDAVIEADLPVPQISHAKKPTLSVEEASERIGPKVLEALEENFNGSLTELRLPDEKDQLLP